MSCFFFFQAEDGIRYLVRSRGLGDVYKRQQVDRAVSLGQVLFVKSLDALQVFMEGSRQAIGQHLSLIHI